MIQELKVLKINSSYLGLLNPNYWSIYLLLKSIYGVDSKVVYLYKIVEPQYIFHRPYIYHLQYFLYQSS